MGSLPSMIDNLSDWLNASDTGSLTHKKPIVILSYAVSLDGSITLKKGQSTAISSKESSAAVHYIRAFCDAIMVGIGTLLSDNPSLSVRLVPGNNPIPVILDSNLKTPLSSKMFSSGSKPIIFCAPDPDKRKRQNLEKNGATIIETIITKRGLSLSSILEELYQRGIHSLMVEGGAEILRSFLEEKIWDKMAVTVAPLFLNGYNILGGNSPGSALRFKSVRWMEAGIDQICMIDREPE